MASVILSLSDVSVDAFRKFNVITERMPDSHYVESPYIKGIYYYPKRADAEKIHEKLLLCRLPVAAVTLTPEFDDDMITSAKKQHPKVHVVVFRLERGWSRSATAAWMVPDPEQQKIAGREFIPASEFDFWLRSQLKQGRSIAIHERAGYA